jgi:hypothetical protein
MLSILRPVLMRGVLGLQMILPPLPRKVGMSGFLVHRHHRAHNGLDLHGGFTETTLQLNRETTPESRALLLKTSLNFFPHCQMRSTWK